MATALGALPGCQESLSDVDGAFYNGDHRLVHCGVDLDTTGNVSIASIDAGLDRARDRHEVIELYAHNPGGTVPISKIEHVLAGASARGLSFVTYADFARGTDAAPGLALSFDDTSVDAWFALRETFRRYHARITFFVSRYYSLEDDQRAELAALASDGHDIEAHSVRHLHAPGYVEDHGLNAYVHDEVDPSIAVLRSQGFEVHAFAYPFGTRTGELDHAIAKRVPVIRSITYTYMFAEPPCPQ
ncbi:MAG TPA: polysaccharide deacetylase family protein [Kofleriaceae bacterium]